MALFNLVVNVDVKTHEEGAKFLEEVAKELRAGNIVGFGWELEELDNAVEN